jgi:hypothetical protein
VLCKFRRTCKKVQLFYFFFPQCWNVEEHWC